MAKQAKTLLNDSFKEAEKQLKLVTDETKNLLSNMTDKGYGNRLEDVWGGVSDGNCQDALTFSWNETLELIAES